MYFIGFSTTCLSLLSVTGDFSGITVSLFDTSCNVYATFGTFESMALRSVMRYSLAYTSQHCEGRRYLFLCVKNFTSTLKTETSAFQTFLITHLPNDNDSPSRILSALTMLSFIINTYLRYKVLMELTTKILFSGM